MSVIRLQFTLFFTCIFLNSIAQNTNTKIGVEAQTIGSSSSTPFWLRSNQYGSVPEEGLSVSFLGRIKRSYDTVGYRYFSKPKTFDWGAGLESRINAGTKSEILLIEAYIKAKGGPFQIKLGRSKETMGLTGDTSLTSGSFAVSGNALGIPKVELSIPEYYTLPVFNGLFAFKGTFSHGWVGKVPLQENFSETVPLIPEVTTYLHQKSLYGRFGRPDWKVKLFGGFNHQAYWGNERTYYGRKYEMNNLQSFKYVLLGQAYGKGVERSKVGNQLGSIDMGFTYDLSNIEITVYRQNFYDVGALAYLANILDGLNGITIKNKKDNNAAIQWKTLLFEFFHSKNQAGETWSKITPSGDENYYNNYLYLEGWSYKRMGLGSPFISTKQSVRDGLASSPRDFFINNRVIAFHAGLKGSIYDWEIGSKISYSLNFGTYATTIGESYGKKRHPVLYGYFDKVNQLSTYLEARRALNENLNISCITAFDGGGLLNNSSAMILKISKQF